MFELCRVFFLYYAPFKFSASLATPLNLKTFHLKYYQICIL